MGRNRDSSPGLSLIKNQKVMKSLKEVLKEREGYTEEEAEQEIQEGREELNEMIVDDPIGAQDFCEYRWGLEPDYLMDLLP